MDLKARLLSLPAWSRSAVAWGILLPPPLFFGWMVLGRFTLGNDYQVYPVEAALTLRAYPALGVEPMWLPHLSGGFPIGGLVLAQAFHFPAWLSSLMPGYWAGHAVLWFSLRHLVQLAVMQLMYYAMMRRLTTLGRLEAYLVSFAATYNQRVLDALRYGPALDHACYAQGLLVLATAYLLKPAGWMLPVLAGFLQLLITSDYPASFPGDVFAVLPLLPAILSRARSDPAGVVRRSGQVLSALLVGLLLAAPHWMAFLEYLPLNYRRIQAHSLEWSNQYPLGPESLVASLISPWAAEVHSAFGGSTLIVLVLGALVAVILRDLPRRWPLLLVLALPFAYAAGAPSPVFRLFFRFVPGFAMTRAPGRALAALPLIVFGSALWLLRSPAPGTNHGRLGTEDLRAATRISARLNLALIVVALVLICWMPGWWGSETAPPQTGPRAPGYIPASLAPVWTVGPRVAWLLLGLMACAGSAFVYERPRPATALLVAATFAQTAMMLRYGTWVWERFKTATLADFRDANHLPLHAGPPLPSNNGLLEGSYGAATIPYTTFVKEAGAAANCFLPIDPGLKHKGVLIPFYLSTHLTCLRSASDVFAALEDFECRRGSAIETYVVGNLAGRGCATLRASWSNRDLVGPNRQNVLESLGPNGLALSVDTPDEAVLVSPYPDVTSNWTGWVDGRRARLLQVNGAFVGLEVPRGRHRVGLQYFSKTMILGYRIAFVTALAVALGFVLVWRRQDRGPGRRGLRAVLALAFAVLATFGYAAWERSFRERARAKVLLNNNYADLLSAQLARWSR